MNNVFENISFINCNKKEAKTDKPNTYIDGHSFFWFSTDTSIKGGEFKLVLLVTSLRAPYVIKTNISSLEQMPK